MIFISKNICLAVKTYIKGFPSFVEFQVIMERGTKRLRLHKKNCMDLGWFGDDLGTVWEYSRHDFGSILKM